MRLCRAFGGNAGESASGVSSGTQDGGRIRPDRIISGRCNIASKHSFQRQDAKRISIGCDRLQRQPGFTGPVGVEEQDPSSDDACCFGVDGSGAGDNPSLLDGGSGTAERISILFGQDVIVEGVLISSFGPRDAGGIDIKGYPEIPLGEGFNDLGGVAAGGTSANYIYWRGANVSDPELGLSVDALVFRAVPEPTVMAAAFFAAVLGTRRTRRRCHF